MRVRSRWRTVQPTWFVPVRLIDYGLRRYEGVTDSVWSTDPSHAHEWRDASWTNPNGSGGWQGGIAQSGLEGGLPLGAKVTAYQNRRIPGAFCACGAWRGTLGNEQSADCGRPLMELRPDLTDEERAYVIGELERLGIVW